MESMADSFCLTSKVAENSDWMGFQSHLAVSLGNVSFSILLSGCREKTDCVFSGVSATLYALEGVVAYMQA